MEVNVKQAVKYFFSNSSFEMIYMEAFSNALDAGATSFSIEIELPNSKQIENLTMRLKDNGVGFTEERFDKFSTLLDASETSHKGLGRLVYLCYFDTVKVESIFDNGKQRIFVFDENYKKNSTVSDCENTETGSILSLCNFNGERLKRNENIKAGYIKRILLDNFYMRFYNAKISNSDLNVSIKCTIDGEEETSFITLEELPSFKVFSLEESINLFDKFEVVYHISEFKPGNNSNTPIFITALSIDERSMPVEIIAKENVSQLYNMIFLLRSESLQGSSDESRQNIKIEEGKLKALLSLFRKAIYQIVNKEIPKIAKKNKKTFKKIQDLFPHLKGLIDEDAVGILSYNDVIKKAQDKFFKTERDLLGATTLTDEQFDLSMEFSSRSLATYIIYRQKLIERMKSLTPDNVESDIHNLLAKKYKKFTSDKIEEEIYQNNIWILDDKFMTYDQVLSEANMNEVIKVLCPDSDDPNIKGNNRPDISIFFSNDPSDKKIDSFDIVIVELKRLGIGAKNNSIVEFQLDSRTRALGKYFGNRIQRAWFYGIVDIDEEYKTHLLDEQFKPLFSHGNIFYRSKPVYNDSSMKFSVIQNAYIMDYKALIEDADSRNNAFLKILKDKFSTPFE